MAGLWDSYYFILKHFIIHLFPQFYVKYNSDQ